MMRRKDWGLDVLILFRIECIHSLNQTILKLPDRGTIRDRIRKTMPLLEDTYLHMHKENKPIYRNEIPSLDYHKISE